MWQLVESAIVGQEEEGSRPKRKLQDELQGHDVGGMLGIGEYMPGIGESMPGIGECMPGGADGKQAAERDLEREEEAAPLHINIS